MSETILAVEDDKGMLTIIHALLQDAGYTVFTAANGLEGLRAFYNARPDLIVLDIAMPVMDGITMCRRVREVTADVPIVMLTALTSESDIVAGLDAGADEYIVKPFRRSEFLARIRSVLRRYKLKVVPSPITYKNGHLEIDLAARLVQVEGQEINLTSTEFRLLELLLQNIGQTVSTKDILEQVWGREYLGDTDYPRTYIWHLRLKIEPDPKHPIYVLNEPGVGYRFVDHRSPA